MRGYKIAGLEKDAFSGKGVHINATVDGFKGGVHVSFGVDKNGNVVAFINDKISEKAKKEILDPVNKNLLTDRGFMQKRSDQAKHVAESSKYDGHKTAAETGRAASNLFDAIKNWLSQ